MGPFLFLPGPQVYSGEHGQGAKNSGGQVLNVPCKKVPTLLRLTSELENALRGLPSLSCPRMSCLANVWIELSLVLTMARSWLANAY